jgi:hypothetical protein
MRVGDYIMAALYIAAAVFLALCALAIIGYPAALERVESAASRARRWLALRIGGAQVRPADPTLDRLSGMLAQEERVGPREGCPTLYIDTPDVPFSPAPWTWADRPNYIGFADWARFVGTTDPLPDPSAVAAMDGTPVGMLAESEDAYRLDPDEDEATDAAGFTWNPDDPAQDEGPDEDGPVYDGQDAFYPGAPDGQSFAGNPPSPMFAVNDTPIPDSLRLALAAEMADDDEAAGWRAVAEVPLTDPPGYCCTVYCSRCSHPNPTFHVRCRKCDAHLSTGERPAERVPLSEAVVAEAREAVAGRETAVGKWSFGRDPFGGGWRGEPVEPGPPESIPAPSVEQRTRPTSRDARTADRLPGAKQLARELTAARKASPLSTMFRLWAFPASWDGGDGWGIMPAGEPLPAGAAQVASATVGKGTNARRTAAALLAEAREVMGEWDRAVEVVGSMVG